MTNEELCFTPATALSGLIRDKIVSPVEIMTAVVERAQALNPRLNAICTPTYDAAIAAAREAEAAVMRGAPLGLLHGVPTTIKDLALTKGVRTMSGSHIFRDRVPDLDHAHVERLQVGRRHLDRQDHRLGVRLEGQQRQPFDRDHAQSLEARLQRRRIERRRGGVCRRWHRARSIRARTAPAPCACLPPSAASSA